MISVRRLLLSTATAGAAFTLTAAPVAAASISFAPAVTYSTGSWAGPGPGAVTTLADDFDGDGDVDVVIADFLGTGPRLLRNQGDGTFGSGTTIASAPGIGSLAAGDLDGDGDTDIVGRTGWDVTVLRNSGNGTFTVSGRYSSVENAQQAVDVGDLDGDGDLDIVTPTPAGILTLRNNGTGTFANGPTTLAFGLFSDLTVANLDGDSVPDLLVADATPAIQRVRALLGNGDGSFSEAGGAPVSFGPEGVMAADLDGDGDDDAISVDSFSVFNSLQFTITVLKSDGSGGLVATQQVATGAGPVSGAVADFDGDGDIDAAVSSVIDGKVTVYGNDGTGTMSTAGTLTATPFPQTPAAADLDGNGQVDMAIPGPGNLAILLNQS